ncbi:MAG: methylmalonyl-CoA carboxyltransferase [Ramlibacter sp.]|jgi:acetyl-CoA carboxylase carboxyltransferase component|nr:methylmalonyl-CoA carboxyltransferase [Ramlibacter sp.]
MTVQSPSDDLERRRVAALAMGGEAKLKKRREKGILDARQRIDHLLDPGSFHEVGLHGTSVMPADRERTPADGKIAGYGRIDGRDVGIVSNDFTVKGASSSATNGRKIGHIKRVATQRGMPIVFLGESSGARMPDTMGARGMGTMLGSDGTQYLRMRETPWAAAVLGDCYGSSTWYTCCSDFAVMRKGAVMAVSSPGLVEQALSETVDPQTLGGWKLHAETTGLIDRAVDTDEEALAAIRQFLSYMPSHHGEAPPRTAVPAGSGANADQLAKLIPARRTQVYDVRKIIAAIVDQDSAFELKPQFGKVAVTTLARLDGHVVGIVANNPMFKGGALDTDACDKITSFLVLCDSFNIPLIILVDTPGFSIGPEAERRRAPGKIMNFMNALSLCTVPKLSVILRKSYGQAYLNMGGGRNSDEVAAWPGAEISFMDPNFAVRIVHGHEPGSPEFAEALREMERDNSVYGIAEIFGVQAVIRPEETRDHLIRLLEVHQLRRTNGVGEHLMRAWPTSY